MSAIHRTGTLAAALLVAIVAAGVTHAASEPDARPFNARAAAAYLDARAESWSTWSNAQRDRGTFCMSCHTTLPYALARPELRGRIGETQPSAAEEKIL